MTNPGRVDPQYRHGPKYLAPRANLELKGASLKWYNLHKEGAAPADALEQRAREHLLAESRADQLALDGDLGFVVLHRCGSDFYFLIVSTWRNENELWEAVYYQDGDKMPGFAPFPRDQLSKPAYCVWELGAVYHEQQAWVRYLTSARDDGARRAYLEDRFTGQV